MADDREFQRWLKTFYEGSFLVPGWNSRKKEILSFVQDKKQEAAALLDEAGEIIGNEWAKDNRVRKIATSDIVNWGDAMKRTKGTGDDNVIAVIQGIKQEALKKLGREA